MTNRHRTVAGRMASLEPTPPEANLTIAAVSQGGVWGGDPIDCTITGYCRTQVFEFPGIAYNPTGSATHMPLYTSGSIRAHVTSDILNYFDDAASSKHYSISPSLRHKIGETNKTTREQDPDGVPVFVIVEEVEQLTPVVMVKGECRIHDQVIERDGEQIAVLNGGIPGERFLAAWHTMEGAWPEIPDNQRYANMILAGVRAGQKTAEPIRKHVDMECLVTSDGRFVSMRRMEMSARASVVTHMDTPELQKQVSEIATAIAAMEQDIGLPHLALLVDSMYSDEHKDDPFKRLQYLRLWESLVESGRKPLGYKGDIREDKVALAGNHTLRELKEYRHDIAHWWTDSIDENYLTNLQRTINELIQQKYF